MTKRDHSDIRYDTRCYFDVRSKADISQLNLPHRQRQRSTTEKTAITFNLLSYILYHIIKILHEQNWLQFLFAVKATALKLLPKFYPQFLSTEASYHMYATQWPVVNVEDNFNFCA